jgi:sarcosine oxidase subunit alpha
MSQKFRNPEGGRIDRSRPVSFTFDGKTYQGYEGDTLASALLANGVHLLGRSFKYHRPRGILTAGSEEPNAIVELRTGARKEPNTRATTIELFDGLVANSQNRWPSLSFDVMAINNLFSPLLSAGFYYKTFMWPVSFWTNVYEHVIRRAAGLGTAPTEADPDFYEQCHEHCDVLVVGAGPAGLMAAMSAANLGARVIIADEHAELGGSLNSEDFTIDGKSGSGSYSQPQHGFRVLRSQYDGRYRKSQRPCRDTRARQTPSAHVDALPETGRDHRGCDRAPTDIRQ